MLPLKDLSFGLGAPTIFRKDTGEVIYTTFPKLKNKKIRNVYQDDMTRIIQNFDGTVECNNDRNVQNADYLVGRPPVIYAVKNNHLTYVGNPMTPLKYFYGEDLHLESDVVKILLKDKNGVELLLLKDGYLYLKLKYKLTKIPLNILVTDIVSTGTLIYLLDDNKNLWRSDIKFEKPLEQINMPPLLSINGDISGIFYALAENGDVWIMGDHTSLKKTSMKNIIKLSDLNRKESNYWIVGIDNDENKVDYIFDKYGNEINLIVIPLIREINTTLPPLPLELISLILSYTDLTTIKMVMDMDDTLHAYLEETYFDMLKNYEFGKGYPNIFRKDTGEIVSGRFKLSNGIWRDPEVKDIVDYDIKAAINTENECGGKMKGFLFSFLNIKLVQYSKSNDGTIYMVTKNNEILIENNYKDVYKSKSLGKNIIKIVIYTNEDDYDTVAILTDKNEVYFFFKKENPFINLKLNFKVKDIVLMNESLLHLTDTDGTIFLLHLEKQAIKPVLEEDFINTTKQNPHGIVILFDDAGVSFWLNTFDFDKGSMFLDTQMENIVSVSDIYKAENDIYQITGLDDDGNKIIFIYNDKTGRRTLTKVPFL